MMRSLATLEKPIEWVGSAKADLSAFPAEVRRVMGYALRVAQQGGRHEDATPLRGDLHGVMEIHGHDASGTYRTMYTTKLGHVVYVLHAFQKKSKRGIATPFADLAVIKQRLHVARMHHRTHHE